MSFESASPSTFHSLTQKDSTVLDGVGVARGPEHSRYLRCCGASYEGMKRTKTKNTVSEGRQSFLAEKCP